MSQKKKVTTPPFDPAPFVVEDVRNDQVIIRRGGKALRRNKAQLKLLNPRPNRLRRRGAAPALGKQEAREHLRSLQIDKHCHTVHIQ